MLLTSLSAPSAVAAMAMPSLALRTPWFMPRIDAVIDEAMAMPAAASLPELMREPVDRRCMAWDSIALAAVLALPARSAAMFVPMTVMITPQEQKRTRATLLPVTVRLRGRVPRFG